MNSSESTILVTGFGPFSGHEVNASWEAVKELYQMRDYLRERHNVNLIIENIPVAYDHVFERVPQLWKEHDPRFVLHVGVSGVANCLTIEHKAHGSGYVCRDVNDNCPTEKYNETSSQSLETEIDVEKLCRKINDKFKNDDSRKACVSHNAGRYLCEYIYYRSLCNNTKRTLFIHVPDFNVCTSKLVAEGLCEIIELLMEDV